MTKVKLLLLLLFLTGFVLAAKAVQLPGLIKPGFITADNDQLFIVDGTTVYIYSLKDFSLQTKFGRRGEGPQEFQPLPRINRNGVALNIQPDSIIVFSVGKASYFTRAGKFKGQSKTFSFFDNYTVWKDRFVGLGNKMENEIEYMTVNIYDPQFTKEKEIGKIKSYDRRQKLKATSFLKQPLLYSSNDKIFLNDDDGLIHVFDKNGKELEPIKLDYTPKKFSSSDKDKYWNFFKTDSRFKPRVEVLKKIMGFPDSYPKIRHFLVSGKKIYVLTYNDVKEKKEFLIYDLSGKFLGKKLVPLQEMNVLELCPYTIFNGKLYQIIENEESEEWELRIDSLE
jgi:hypothetical protein